MEILKVKDYDQMSEKAADIVMEHLQGLDKPVLGLATGSTPEGLYRQLIKRNRAKEISFQNVITFNLDEYIGVKPEDKQSYHYYMNQHLFQHIDMDKRNVHIPNGTTRNEEEECKLYERQLMHVGPIDIQILGIGVNGHIGFNEPGTSFQSKTHVVELAESTRLANSRYFNSLDEVPTKAITMGIDTIMNSKTILLLVSGEKKAAAVKKLIDGEITEAFPASILQQHPKVYVIADEAALREVPNRNVVHV